MTSEAGKALYKQRAQAECPNAWARRMGLTRLSVRGTAKARAVLLWFALAHNMLRAFACGAPSWPRQPELVDRDANSMTDIPTRSTICPPLSTGVTDETGAPAKPQSSTVLDACSGEPL